MSEWLTLGQVIDLAKVGDFFEPNDSRIMKLGRFPDGFHWLDKNNNIAMNCYDFVPSPTSINTKWMIVPKYVDFHKAMEAYKNGKRVYFCGKKHLAIEPIKLPSSLLSIKAEEKLTDYSMLSLYEGNWTIEE